MIPKPLLLSRYIWFARLHYVSRISFAYEAALANDFSSRTMQCPPQQLTQRLGVLPEYQGRALTGSQLDGTTVTGDRYLGPTFDYSRTDLWRNFSG